MRAKHTVAPTLAIEGALLSHAETATSFVAPSEGQNKRQNSTTSLQNSTTSIESVGLQGHDTSPPPNASQVGTYSEQDALTTETQYTESCSINKSTHTTYSDLYTQVNDRPHMGTLQPIRDVYHATLDHGLVPK